MAIVTEPESPSGESSGCSQLSSIAALSHRSVYSRTRGAVRCLRMARQPFVVAGVERLYLPLCLLTSSTASSAERVDRLDAFGFANERATL